MRIMGITRIRKWLAGIASAVVILLVVALPVLAYTYAGTAVVTVTESAGTTYANLPITMTVNNSYMATNGFMQSNGLDAAVVGTGGIALPTMIDSTQTLFVAPVTKSTQNGFNFTTGNTPVTSMPIIVGNSGYVTTADNAALEPGSNFSIAATGYLDTSSPVATGNTITNGTGVATGSPITLAAGANTITSTAPTLTGTTVVNGTGVATGSPITLIGGLNTITISTLGTFTVTLGTGLSGYATSGASCLVTGSPLTLSAGSNTITTTIEPVKVGAVLVIVFAPAAKVISDRVATPAPFVSVFTVATRT